MSIETAPSVRSTSDAVIVVDEQNRIIEATRSACDLMGYTREDLLSAARNRDIEYEHQVEDADTQTVRLYGENTAIVTARLWLKGTQKEGPAFDRRLWFSDTYVRTPEGWRYAFGQASISLPNP